MSIIGLGIDFFYMLRIKKICSTKKKKLANKLLNNNELKDYIYNYNESYRFLSKIFAIKEAASKALGIGMRNGLNFHSFEIYKNKIGKPKIKFLNYAHYLKKKKNINKIHVTITYENNYIFALVILES
ncbi:Holo-[acyl-carrier-protein] synthase [Candidatus Annandia adelgestsuga]|uniref:Holo-[acyl-carrier-protein] synthase n=1 Tax=Candidatus Annandia adelgestsuga TaxID=1302411 RepID=A0A3Q9CLJ3_9ENTR|nr:holo-ACP synthase [Candidatus Annandia adelgestsuga]AZP36340.1 Holo-[acyl-carrier-protein] synthase [Candidatus Annandia adelgestsuga]